MFWCDYPRDVVQVSGADASTWTFLLQPTGKVEVLARVWRVADDTYVLDTDAGFGDALAARVNRFKIRVQAEVSVLPWRCIAVRGGEGQGLATWATGYDLLGGAPVPPDGVSQGSAADLLAARIDAAWPAMGTEIEPGETIPAELGVNDLAVSFTKGCYPGQELVERMDSRAATAPRLLQRLTRADAERLGARITSEAGDAVLAFVPRSALPD